MSTKRAAKRANPSKTVENKSNKKVKCWYT